MSQSLELSYLQNSERRLVVNKTHKNGTTTFLAISAILLLGVVIFFLMKEKRVEPVVGKPATHHPAEQKSGVAMVRGLVPELMDITHEFMGVESMSQVTPEQLRTSAELILSLEGNPFLSTPDDREIFQFLKKHKINWKSVSELIGGKGRTAYSCVSGEFTVGPIQASTEILALSFYHELRHASDCFKYLEEHGTSDASKKGYHSPNLEKGFEEVAYAAQVRFFLALYSRGMLPKQVSAATPNNDGGVLEQTLQAWEAIYDDKFEEWYDRMLMEVRRGRVTPSFIHKVEPGAK